MNSTFTDLVCALKDQFDNKQYDQAISTLSQIKASITINIDINLYSL